MHDSTTIVGHVGKAPTVTHIDDERTVCDFPVAVHRRRKDGEITEWFTVTAWNKLAELCEKYVDTGMVVLAEGEVVAESWTDKVTGELKSKIKLTARHIRFITYPKRIEPEDDFDSDWEPQPTHSLF